MTSSVSSSFSLMTILNITPDSFSDGGVLNTPEKLFEFVQKKVLKLQGERSTYLDFGAESTATKNSPISDVEEWRRVETILIPFLKLMFDEFPTTIPSLSLDTYRFETFWKFYQEVETLVSTSKGERAFPHLVWNDISGAYDLQKLKKLWELPNGSKLSYVLSYNESAKESARSGRDVGSNHLSYTLNVRPEEIVDKAATFFSQAIEELTKHFGEKRIKEHLILDPLFGFAKDREQNIYLMNNLKDLVGHFSKEYKWLLGISKKSFLRTLFDKALNSALVEEEREERIELRHFYYLLKWMEEMIDHQLIFRVHNPVLFHEAKRLIHLTHI